MTTRKRSGGRPATSRRDFKSSGGGDPRHRLPGWLWLGIGLLSGVVMALFVYVRDQDIERRPPESKPPAAAGSEPPPKRSGLARPEKPQSQPEPEETIFEFYDMLPKMLRGEGETEAAAREKEKVKAAAAPKPPRPGATPKEKQQPPLAAKSPAAAKPQAAPTPKQVVAPAPSAAKPRPGRSTPALVYYLQAGSFQHFAQADRLRAQLAFNGLESHIQRVSGADRSTWHRVRVGPFSSRREADQASTLLVHRFHLRPLLVKARR